MIDPAILKVIRILGVVDALVFNLKDISKIFTLSLSFRGLLLKSPSVNCFFFKLVLSILMSGLGFVGGFTW